MPTIRFRGAVIRYADLRYEEEAGKFVRLHFTADWTDVVREHMEWEDLPDSVTNAKLTGKLTGRNLILTPNGKELQQHELQITVSDVSDFQLFRVKSDDGETKHAELRFIVRSQEPGAMALIESYIEAIGRGDAALKIAHEKQEELPLGEGEQAEAAPEDAGDGDTVEEFQRGQMDKVRARGALASKRQVEIAESKRKPTWDVN